MQKEHNKSIKNLQNYHLFELEEKEKVNLYQDLSFKF